MASSEERDDTFAHLEIERNPGDYYAGKAEQARALREALQVAVNTGAPADQIAALAEALERAEYVGD